VFAEKMPKMWPNPFLPKFQISKFQISKFQNCTASTVENVAENVGYFSNCLPKQLPKVSNHPMGENSPNLVTLVGLLLHTKIRRPPEQQCIQRSTSLCAFSKTSSQ
jgi:hypothetical protein